MSLLYTVPVVSNLAVGVLLSLLFFNFYCRHKQLHIVLWSLGWTLHAIIALGHILFFPLPQFPVFFTLITLLAMLQALAFTYGARKFAQKKTPLVFILFLFAALIFSLFFTFSGGQTLQIGLAPCVFIAVSFLFAGWTLLRQKYLSQSSRFIAGFSLTALGLHQTTYPIMVTWFPNALIWAYLTATMLAMVSAVGLISLSFDRLELNLKTTKNHLSMVSQSTAHSFNNVLMAIINNTQTAENVLAQSQDNKYEIRFLLESVLKSASLGRDMIQKVTSFFEPEDDDNNPWDVIDLSGLLKATTEIAQTSWQQPHVKPIRIIENIQEGLYVLGVKGELFQYFLDTIIFYLTDMDQGGVLKIKAFSQGKNARILFANTSNKLLSKKNKAMERQILNCDLRILHKHNGRIINQKKDIMGRNSLIELPLSPSKRNLVFAKDTKEIDQGLEVLLVEDESLVAMGEAALLTENGCKVTLASNLAEARQALAATRPDIVLCDLGLPDGPGWNLAQDIHDLDNQKKDKPHTSFILITGWSIDRIKDSLRGNTSGLFPPNKILQKPIDREQLIQLLADYQLQKPEKSNLTT